MRHGMSNPRKFQVGLFSDHMANINEQLTVFLGDKSSGENGETEFNYIILKSMPNRWIK